MQKKVIKVDFGLIQDASKLYQKAFGGKNQIKKKIQSLSSDVAVLRKSAQSAVVTYDKAIKEAKRLGMEIDGIDNAMRAAIEIDNYLNDVSRKLDSLR